MKFSIATILTGIILSILSSCSTETKQQQIENNVVPKKSIKNSLNDIYNIKPESPFSFNVGSMFNATISKNDLINAKTIFDITPKEGAENIIEIRDIEIEHLSTEEKITQKGKSDSLNKAQIELLKTLNYADNFYIAAFSTHKTNERREKRCFVNYISVVPETEAEYKSGSKQLRKHIGEQIYADLSNVKKEKLKAGKIKFTIDQHGNLNDAILESSCGYKNIDEKMLKIIKNLPVSWNPAKNDNGTRVKQELYLSFGIWGC